MEIRQIQYFLSIVDTGSFSAAADKHYISQSTLSKNIIALENELGILLFDRSKRKASLTEVGEVFLSYARTLAGVHHRLIAEIDGYKSKTDSFSIAILPVMTQYNIMAHIALFRNLWPNIHFKLEELEGINILPALDEHRFDLAFTRHNYLDQYQYESLEICQDRLLVVVSKQSPYAAKSNISIKELSKEKFIALDKVTTIHTLIMDECHKAGFEPMIDYSSLRIESIFGLVESNIGIALMPKKIYAYYQHPDVLAIPLDETIESNIVLVYLKNRRLSKAARVFVDFMKNTVS